MQVWSPENGIRALFALDPAVYQAFYGQLPALDELKRADQALTALKRNLTPQLRVDRVWHRYLSEPGSFCFANEDRQHFDALYSNHLQLRAEDERGSVLDGPLMDQVTAWVQDESSQPPLRLLADFGEGKSVFSYCLTRRLCESFLADPAQGIFPLRIPLREYAEAGDGRRLLQRRLDELGATIADWRILAGQVRMVVIFDGFDEMSADLSPKAITKNLRGIESCLTELSGAKARVLVTSRQRTLDGTRDWELFIDRLGQQPRILRIAPGSRSERVRYLEQFAADENSARVLASLRNQHDPVGLAAKPLYLQMIKETLTELPGGAFNELVLYERYVDKSLRSKVELLTDPRDALKHAEVIDNLKGILEEIAVRLQEGNLSYTYLRDYQKSTGPNVAGLLWKAPDQATPAAGYDQDTEEDAANRVGIRSLLKAVPDAPHAERWPVDFFHRSMREYFVARAIVRRLRKDPDRAR